MTTRGLGDFSKTAETKTQRYYRTYFNPSYPGYCHTLFYPGERGKIFPQSKSLLELIFGLQDCIFLKFFKVHTLK